MSCICRFTRRGRTPRFEYFFTIAERRRALRGFVIGTFKTEELFAHTFGRTFHPAIDFEVYDGEDASSSSLLYNNNGVKNAGEKGDAALFSEERQIKVAGTPRELRLYFATLPAFERGAKSNLPAFVLVSGVSVSLLLFGITWMLARSRTQAFRASADLSGSKYGAAEVEGGPDQRQGGGEAAP